MFDFWYLCDFCELNSIVWLWTKNSEKLKPYLTKNSEYYIYRPKVYFIQNLYMSTVASRIYKKKIIKSRKDIATFNLKSTCTYKIIKEMRPINPFHSNCFWYRLIVKKYMYRHHLIVKKKVCDNEMKANKNYLKSCIYVSEIE